MIQALSAAGSVIAAAARHASGRKPRVAHFGKPNLVGQLWPFRYCHSKLLDAVGVHPTRSATVTHPILLAKADGRELRRTEMGHAAAMVRTVSLALFNWDGGQRRDRRAERHRKIPVQRQVPALFRNKSSQVKSSQVSRINGRLDRSASLCFVWYIVVAGRYLVSRFN